MNANAVTKTYAKIGVESGIAAADPHKLISMLYQGALMAIANAKNGIMRKDIPAKAAAISKAFMIVDDGLNACLDKKAGGDLAKNLSSLYDYMVIRLTYANLHNDMAALDEVARLLIDLKGAWDSIRQPGVASTPVQHKAVQPKTPLVAASGAKTEPAGAAIPPKAPNKVQMLYGRM